MQRIRTDVPCPATEQAAHSLGYQRRTHVLRCYIASALRKFWTFTIVYGAIYGMKGTIRYLLENGTRGYHHLFADEVLRKGLDHLGDESVDVVTAGQVTALTHFLSEEEVLTRQREVIASAPERAQTVFVRLYFERLFDFLGSEGTVAH